MRWIKWIGFAAAVVLIVSCYYPWVIIQSKNFVIKGIGAEDIHLGKPAYFHFVLTIIYLVFSFTPKIWAKRFNLLVVALNLGWAIRNYFIISACHGGECPEKQTALYLLIPMSVIMLLSSLFPSIKLKEK